MFHDLEDDENHVVSQWKHDTGLGYFDVFNIDLKVLMRRALAKSKCCDPKENIGSYIKTILQMIVVICFNITFQYNNVYADSVKYNPQYENKIFYSRIEYRIDLNENVVRKINGKIKCDNCKVIEPTNIDVFIPYDTINYFNIFGISSGNKSELLKYIKHTISKEQGIQTCRYVPIVNSEYSSYFIEYEITSRPLIPGEYWDSVVIDTDPNSEDLEININIPRDSRFYFQFLPLVKNILEKTTMESSITYSWKIPMVLNNDNNEFVFMISSTPTWEQLASWLAVKYNMKANTEGINSYIYSNIAQQNIQKKEIIYNTLQYIRLNYSPKPIGRTLINPILPSSAEDTFKNKSGDCKDLVVLMRQMLSDMKIPSCPVLTNSRYDYDLKNLLPGMAYFNHAILYVPQQDGISKPLFIDPTRGLDKILPNNQGSLSHSGMILCNDFQRIIEYTDDDINKF